MTSVQNDFLRNRCELIWQFLDSNFVLKIAHASHTQRRIQKPKRTLNFQIMDPHKTDKGMLGPGTSGIRFAKKSLARLHPPCPGTEKQSGMHHSLRSLTGDLASWYSSAQDRCKGAFQIVTRYEAVVQTITKFNHLDPSGFCFSAQLLFHSFILFFISSKFYQFASVAEEKVCNYPWWLSYGLDKREVLVHFPTTSSDFCLLQNG